MKIMKRLSLVGLCLMAVMAISAVVVSSAPAALPEFKTATFPVSFSAKSLLPLEPLLSATVLGQKVGIACQMSESTGKVTSATLIQELLVLYLGCKLEPGSQCHTAGFPAGQIMTKLIKGKPGYLKEPPEPIVGILLNPETGKVFAEFVCPESALGTIKVENATIGEAQKLNLENTTGELIFEETAGKTGQLWNKFVGGPECELRVSAGKAWLMDRELETFSKSIELKG